MAVSTKDKQILSSFPKPPPGLLSPFTPYDPKAPSPKPSPNSVFRPSDFGFIQVVLDTESEKDSLYDEPTPLPLVIRKNLPASISVPRHEPNLGDLRLNLDSPTRSFAPNDVITGYIEGWDSSQSHIHIILEGHAKTHIRTEKAEATDRAPLVYQVTHLSPESQGLVPRFSVTIPSRTQNELETLDEFTAHSHQFHRYWTHNWPFQEPYEHQSNHPLPPSMALSNRTSNSICSPISGQASISYRLLAIRSRYSPTTRTLIPEAASTTPITLTTLRLPSTKLQTLTSQTNTSTPHLSTQTSALSLSRRLSFRQQLRDTFNNNSTPTFYFAPTVSTPSLSYPGAEMEVKISVAVLPPPPGKLYNFPIPDISIISFECRIRSYTGIRVHHTSMPRPGKQGQCKLHTFKNYEMRVSSTPANATFRPKNGGFDGQSCAVTVKVPRSVGSSFKTLNVWRGYKVEVDVGFKVAGKVVEARVQGDLNVVAREGGLVEDVVGAVEREDDLGMDLAKVVVGKVGLELGGLGVRVE